jgi:hypothetical protein
MKGFVLPSRCEVREDATHRFAFECLHFSASQIVSSLGIRAGSLPRYLSQSKTSSTGFPA